MHWVFWLVIGLIVYKIVIAVQNFKSVKWMEANPELARKQNPKLGCSGVLETPPSLPIIGHLANLNLNAIAPSIVPWGKVYGRVFKIRIPDDFTVIADPALLSRVYAGSDWANFDRGGVVSELFDDIGGGLVLLENGEKWQKFRTIFQKSFTKRRLNMSQDFLVSTSKKLCDQVYLFSKSQQVFDLQEEVQKMTFDIIGKLAFGIDFNTQSQHQSQANDCFRTMLSSLMVRFTSPVHWWKYITLPFDRKYERAVNVMHGLIRECIQNYKKNGIDPDDVCALADLMRADDKLPEREIVLHIITLLFAGMVIFPPNPFPFQTILGLLILCARCAPQFTKCPVYHIPVPFAIILVCAVNTAHFVVNHFPIFFPCQESVL